LLLAHGRNDSHQEILALIEVRLDLLADIALRNTDIILGGAVISHQVEETFIDVDKLIFITEDVRDIHVVGGRRDIFHFFAGEDVDGYKVDFGVTVLTGLRGGHLNDLAGTALDDDVPVLAKGRALHRERCRGPSIGLLKGVLVLLVVGSLLYVYWAQYKRGAAVRAAAASGEDENLIHDGNAYYATDEFGGAPSKHGLINSRDRL